ERHYRDWEIKGHGWVNLTRAIIKSCDTFFYELALKLGIDEIYDGMSSFGFGQTTQIDMGEEVPALLPSRGWKRADRNLPWYPGETVIIGIGQGYWNVTPLQLASAAGTMANGGKRYNLILAESIGFRNNMQPIEGVKPPGQLFPFEAKNMKLIRNAMRGVNAPGGTAYSAFRTAHFTSAGKSGTVQLIETAQDKEYDETTIAEEHRDNALFIAFAPFKKPKIAVAVIWENAGGGSTKAGPIAQKVMAFYLLQENAKNAINNTN
ncbi:MAG: penicillin-binding protein 2, partial [Gammaproteobacteria bacterium]|nr:penicillin-binding protein 2 [Gammaproteobacteria bacterium]